MNFISTDDIRYQEVQFLGKGAYSEVYKVTVQGQFYALKKIYPYMLNNPKVKNNVLRQAQIMSKINHPNIIKLHECILRENQINFLLQYASGGTLYQQLKQYGRLPESKVKQYIRDIIKAVTYLHEQNIPIIHRDIKPENLLLDGDSCKLGDFGSSNFMDGKRTSYVGTQQYMAPEMKQNLPHDQSLDVWCIGVLIYELLVGETPSLSPLTLPSFISRTAEDVIKKILVHQPTSRITLNQLTQHIWLLDDHIQQYTPHNLQTTHPNAQTHHQAYQDIQNKNQEINSKLKNKLIKPQTSASIQTNNHQSTHNQINQYMQLLNEQNQLRFQIQLNAKIIRKYKYNMQIRRPLLLQQLKYMRDKIDEYSLNMQILVSTDLKPSLNRQRIVETLNRKMNYLQHYVQNMGARLKQRVLIRQSDSRVDIQELPTSEHIPKLKLCLLRDQRDALIELKTILQRLQHMNQLTIMEKNILRM